MIAVAITRLHIEISSGASAALAGRLNGENLSRRGALGVEESLTGNGTGRGGNDAAEIRVRGGEASGHIGELGGASNVSGFARVGKGDGVVVVVVWVVRSRSGGGSA